MMIEKGLKYGSYVYVSFGGRVLFINSVLT
jgi:hypothetical protein